MSFVDMLRALVVATNSLPYNPNIDPDDAHRYEVLLTKLRYQIEADQDGLPNEPLTEEELLEMDGEAVYLAADHKWYIVSLKFPGPWGNNVPCGVDMWGAGTSLSLLARCGVYRRPPKEA